MIIEIWQGAALTERAEIDSAAGAERVLLNYFGPSTHARRVPLEWFVLDAGVEVASGVW